MNRYFARIVLEAETPLAVGSDSIDYAQDAPVEKDFNGLPYIPGTALAGVFLANISKDLQKYFGNTEDSQPQGSNLIFSDALLYNGHKVIQELKNNLFLEAYFKNFKDLPIRPHAKHDHKATATDRGLFDQEIVFKGSRFKFEMLLESKEDCKEDWELILTDIQSFPLFLGSGQYKGYGLCSINEIKTVSTSTFKEFSEIDNDLNNDDKFLPIELQRTKPLEWKEVVLNTSNSLFHFGSGFGDDDTDALCYKENIINWKENTFEIEEFYVIPATSIKGALAHRVAFYHNLDNGINIEDIQAKCTNPITHKLDRKKFNDEISKITGENNFSVKTMFGTAKHSENDTGNKGRLIIKDIFIPKNQAKEVKLIHNTIDRFTSGTIERALFSEIAIHIPSLTLEYLIEPTSEEQYLQEALNDLKNGTLPIGGLAAKGHGIIN